MGHYVNYRASLFRLCNDFITKMVGDGVIPADSMQVFDWDAHADQDELPNKDLIGPIEYEIEVDEKLHYITTMIGISTINDTNMFRLHTLIDHMFDQLQPEMLVPYVDGATGNQMGSMKALNGTAVMPTAKTKTRPFKAVAVSLASDQTGP